MLLKLFRALNQRKGRGRAGQGGQDRASWKQAAVVGEGSLPAAQWFRSQWRPEKVLEWERMDGHEKGLNAARGTGGG